MMVKLTKEEVLTACAYWLRANACNSEGTDRETCSSTPIAISKEMVISGRYGRNGVVCTVFKRMPIHNLTTKDGIAAVMGDYRPTSKPDIPWIKELRTRTGCSLLEGKHAMELFFPVETATK